MKYIQLNNTDLNISPICLGTAGFGDKSDLEKSFEILNAFVRAGGNFIDTANVYCKWLKGHGNCSEQIIGKWLKESGMQGKVIVATKGAHYSFEDPGRSRVNKEDIRMDLDESCRTLGKDEIDFYWLHRDDPKKPAEEIVDILEELKKEGRIRYYGFSNYRTERLKEIARCLRERNLSGITAVSNQWSLAEINPGGNTNPDPTLVEFSREEYQIVETNRKEKYLRIIPDRTLEKYLSSSEINDIELIIDLKFLVKNVGSFYQRYGNCISFPTSTNNIPSSASVLPRLPQEPR